MIHGLEVELLRLKKGSALFPELYWKANFILLNDEISPPSERDVSLHSQSLTVLGISFLRQSQIVDPL